jgi:hypothetical protein
MKRISVSKGSESIPCVSVRRIVRRYSGAGEAGYLCNRPNNIDSNNATTWGLPRIPAILQATLEPINVHDILILLTTA